MMNVRKDYVQHEEAMPTPTRTDARLDFRLNHTSRRLIDQAASLVGQSVTEFAVATLLNRARQIVQQESLRVLSDRDRDIFLVMLDEDRRPNAALRRAARKYKALYGRKTK